MGEFSNSSVVLQRGLEMLRRESEGHEADLAALRALIDRRRQGGFVDLEMVEAETRAALRAKRKALVAL